MPVETNYEALRESVRDSYRNPKPEIVAEVRQHAGEQNADELMEYHAIFADAYAEIAVAVMKCVNGGKNNAEALADAITLLSVSGMLNLIARVDAPSGEVLRMHSIKHFIAGLDPGTEFVETDSPLQHTQ